MVSRRNGVSALGHLVVISVSLEASLAFYESLALHSTTQRQRQALALHSVTSHMLKEARPERALEDMAVHEAIVSASHQAAFVLVCDGAMTHKGTKRNCNAKIVQMHCVIDAVHFIDARPCEETM